MFFATVISEIVLDASSPLEYFANSEVLRLKMCRPTNNWSLSTKRWESSWLQ